MRINVIDVAHLPDAHLKAEYRNISVIKSV